MVEKKAKVEKTEKKIVATAAVYDILRRPVISEKAARLSENNNIVFEVSADATKTDIVRAIQAIYDIKPLKVNIVVTKGKARTFRGRTGTKSSVKKAYISLPKDAKLDLSVK